MAYERKCRICGAEYRYCPRCDEFRAAPTWMLEFDKDECRRLFYDVVNPYAFKHITKEEAVKRLEGIDLSRRENFPADVRTVLNELLTVEAKPVEEAKPKKRPIFKGKED